MENPLQHNHGKPTQTQAWKTYSSTTLVKLLKHNRGKTHSNTTMESLHKHNHGKPTQISFRSIHLGWSCSPNLANPLKHTHGKPNQTHPWKAQPNTPMENPLKHTHRKPTQTYPWKAHSNTPMGSPLKHTHGKPTQTHHGKPTQTTFRSLHLGWSYDPNLGSGRSSRQPIFTGSDCSLKLGRDPPLLFIPVVLLCDCQSGGDGGEKGEGGRGGGYVCRSSDGHPMDRKHQRELCGFRTCDANFLSSAIFFESRRS